MAYISPSTVTTGDLITAAEWNQDIVANEQASAPDMFTAKGDLFVGTAADAGTKLPVGGDGDVLMADSAQASGLAWADRLTRLMQRQGGSATDWNPPGSTNYTPGQVIMQAGAVLVNISNGSDFGTAVVTLPAAFSAAPLVLATFQSAAAVAGTTVWAAAGTTSITVRVNRTGTTGDVSVGVAWLAIGPA